MSGKSSVDINQPDVSQPLPIIRVKRPTADRGAKRERDILDMPRCEMCDVPVARDERNITVEEFGGVLAHHHVCKNHSEHPNSWRRATSWNPDEWRFCPKCENVKQIPTYSSVCHACDPEWATTVQEQQRKLRL